MNRNRFLQSLGLVSGGLAVTPVNSVFASPAEFSEVLHRIGNEGDFWKSIREQFTYPADYIYFNTGGIGASPRAVLEMVEKTMVELEKSPRPGHDEKEWQQIKKTCTPFFGPGCEPEELALTNTATEGINIILNGLQLKPGDEVITSTHEHVALNVPLLNHQKLNGIVIRFFEPDPKDGTNNINLISNLISPKTRLIFHSHITCTAGQVLPITEIGRLARERNILYAVDGAQSAGTMPIDLKASGIDFFATCGHKWMLGPKRTGFLYVQKDKLPLLHPTTVGAYSDVSHDLVTGELTLHDTAEKFEYGTQNETLFRGLSTAAQFLLAIGLDKIKAHNRSLAEQFYQGLLKIPGMEILSPTEEQYRSSMITFRLKNKGYQETASYLTSEKRIRVRVVPEAGLNAVRASFHVYNQDFEVEKILDELKKYAG
ncbi:MAG: aminotransferase class V-fold PLP-dependent enzyme [Bacteroidales bacterium]|jgi:selenocysteine lyase/cysteine desulfurase